MNKEYIKKIFEDNKEKLKDSEFEINSPQDLENQIIAYITSNMQYDFDIDIDEDKLFSSSYSKDLEEVELEK